ncbi:hypothetical protein [Cohnella cholangitidis]|uniref:Uncharacterized protein n=1 Tax=Cohnella cholangitidis TaxID=2598458 RepID=A0A7G5C1L2_9BACL|nr:hypothetical protein [Cohnella cholangitidis]QMV43096.1 hypothetical protein FPL14_19325 [Cohnella cholangitidis]
MEMKRDMEREFIKNRLDEELSALHFTKENEVLRRTHPRSWKERLTALWNKEIEVPLFPLGASMAVILTVITLTQLQSFMDADGSLEEQRQLIEAGGNTYWKDDYEKAVASVESDLQS